jgi:hypothetical protein
MKFNFKKFLIVWAILIVCAVIFDNLFGTDKQVYVGPTMQTTSGEYFCIYEDEVVFQEYMQEGNHE